MTLPSAKTSQAKQKAVVNETDKIRRKFLREIKRRLRELEKRAGLNYVAFRLGIPLSRAASMLDGQTKITMNTMSDLALAVGCRIEVTARHLRSQSKRKA